MGEFMYGNPNAPLRPGSNRDLLMETCVSLDLVIGNTLHEVAPREQITFFAIGAAHDSELTPNISRRWTTYCCLGCCSSMWGPSGVMSARRWPATTSLFKQRW